MAEVLGAVASGVGIASFIIQVACSIKKAKHFIDLMKDAPNELRYFMEGIEQLNTILDFIDQQSQQISIPSDQGAFVLGAFNDCRKAALDLSSLAKDLESAISAHSTKGRAKFAFKKQALDSFRMRLEAAKTTVLLCQQSCSWILQQNMRQYQVAHLHEFRQFQRDIIDTRTMVQAPGQASSISSQSWARSTGRLKKHSTKNRNWQPTSIFGSLFGSVYYSSEGLFGVPMKCCETQEITIRICTPAWLFRKVYEINKFRDSWTCQFSLQSYNIVPFDAPLFEYAEAGDVEALKGLFESKAATPFDRSIEDGSTALHLAARNGHDSVCQFLLELGADAYALDIWNSTPLNCIQYYAINHGDEHSKVMNIFRMFLVTYQGDNLVDFGNTKTPWQRYLARHSHSAPLARGLALALEQAYPPYYERPLEERLEFATLTLNPMDNWAPDVENFRLAISKESIDPRCFHILPFDGFNLTREIICSMATCIYFNKETTTSGWCSMLKEAVGSKVDLHNMSDSGDTALDIFTRFWKRRLGGDRLRERKLNAAVRRFLGALEDSGVDLLTYGAKQSEVWQKDLDDYCQRSGVDSAEPFEGRYFTWDLGSSVDDWHVYIEYWPHFSYAGDFWYMVENPWERIPGAWVD